MEFLKLSKLMLVMMLICAILTVIAAADDDESKTEKNKILLIIFLALGEQILFGKIELNEFFLCQILKYWNAVEKEASAWKDAIQSYNSPMSIVQIVKSAAS